jgi:hypothetical protein
MKPAPPVIKMVMREGKPKKDYVHCHDILRLYLPAVAVIMQPAPRFSTKLIAGLTLVVGLIWVGMFAGTHLPIQTAPTNDPYSLDKLEHIAAFALLAGVLATLAAALKIANSKLLPGVFAVVATYGLLDEVTQSLVRNRQADMLDWLADMAGAALGLAIFAGLQRFFQSRSKAATGTAMPET